MKMYLKVKNGVIEDVKFNTYGCASAIATSSIATDMIKGRAAFGCAEAHQSGGCRGAGRPAGGQDSLFRFSRAGDQSRDCRIINSRHGIDPEPNCGQAEDPEEHEACRIE